MSLATYMDEHSSSAAEVMFERQVDEALPYRLYRADMASNDDGTPQITDVNPSTHLSFEPFGIEFMQDVTASVRPFVWNDLGIRSNTTLPAEPVEEWAMRWLDMEDQLSKDEHGLQGVIHAIVREDADDGSTLLTIDLGSAPVDALQELIELALSAGVTHLSIHSETLQ